MDPSDEALVAQSASGDGAAFAELVRRHCGAVAALARRLVADADHAEDCVQNTLLAAWLGIARLREPGRVRAWLMGIARKRCRDHLRRASRRERPAGRGEIEVRIGRAGPRVGRPSGAEDETAELLAKATPAEREAARMFYLEGLKVREIARRTRAPVGTVKRRLHSARERMRGRPGERRP
ncbi:MAG: RNA polymerase sigma factor [Planctomycetota bacterium]|jgi:RNA polymerase sigma-70 factor (ECF subfamily)